MKKRTRRKRVPLRRRTDIQRDVQLLKNWASNGANLELIAHLPAGSLTHPGRVVELGGKGGTADFMFVATSGMYVRLTPAIWQGSTFEAVANLWRALHIHDNRGQSSSLAIREIPTRTEPKPENEPLVAKVLAQLRTWIKLGTNVHALFCVGRISIALVVAVRETRDGVFHFIQEDGKLQLIVEPRKFTGLQLEVEQGYSVVDFSGPRESLMLYDKNENPEELFARLRFPTRSVQ